MQGLYREYAGRIHRAMRATGEVVSGEYDCERNEGGSPGGKGTMVFKDGDRYIGEWKDGKQHGPGELQSASGNVYKGSFHEGLRQGHGKQVFGVGGSMFEGEWRAGDPHGTGSMVHMLKGEFSGRYVGDYRRGKREGSGTWQFANGDVYRGQWSGGRIDGVGIYQAHDGYTVSAIWQRVEWKDARSKQNAPDGVGLKWQTGAEICAWDPINAKLSIVTDAKARELQEEHSLPWQPTSPLPSLTELTPELRQPFDDVYDLLLHA